MTTSAQTLFARVNARGLAVLDTNAAAVDLAELHQTIGRCHQDADVRAVVVSRRLITGLLATPRPFEKGTHE